MRTSLVSAIFRSFSPRMTSRPTWGRPMAAIASPGLHRPIFSDRGVAVPTTVPPTPVWLTGIFFSVLCVMTIREPSRAYLSSSLVPLVIWMLSASAQLRVSGLRRIRAVQFPEDPYEYPASDRRYFSLEAYGSKSRFMLCPHARALGEIRGLRRMPTKSQKKRNKQREERRLAYGMLDSTDVWGSEIINEAT